MLLLLHLLDCFTRSTTRKAHVATLLVATALVAAPVADGAGAGNAGAGAGPGARAVQKLVIEGSCDYDSCPYTSPSATKGRECDLSCESGEYGELGCAAKGGKYGPNCRACFYSVKKALESDTRKDRAIMCDTLRPVDIYSAGPLVFLTNEPASLPKTPAPTITAAVQGAATTPEPKAPPVSNGEELHAVVVDEVQRLGTVAAGAVSTLAVAGILVVSAGSIIAGSSGSAPRSLPSTPGALANLDGSSGGGSASRGSQRRPAATLATVLVAQLQFLATLSLVDSTVREESLLADFVVGLRWINLWWPAEVGSDIASEQCAFDAEASELGALVFVGNLVLVVGILLGVFLLHILIVSGVEAFWLTKKRARENLAAARLCATPVSELQGRHAGGVQLCLRRTPSGLDDPGPLSSRTSQASSAPQCSEDENEQVDGRSGGEAGAARGVIPARRARSRLGGPVAACREHSTSVWLHFPHVELVFLFFAFEGAVGSFASAMRHSECPEMFYTALAALVSYPLLMFVAVFQTVLVRVYPDSILVFTPYDDDSSAESSRGGLLSRFRTGWKEDSSLFSWADRGQWETVETDNRQLRREGDWFRIGFEPLFVDYTKRGVWFVVISLVEWTSIALIGVMIDDSVIQLLGFCELQVVMFALLVCLKPFANSAVNNIGASVVGIDAVCMGLLAAAATVWEGTSREGHAFAAVFALQLFTLWALVFPMYVDTLAIVTRAIRDRIQKSMGKTGQKVKGDEQEARGYTRGYIRRHWCGTWCAMLRHNFFACARDTTEGMRRPRFSPTAARSGPYPPLDPPGPVGGRTSANAIVTVDTTVFAGSEKLD